MLKVLKNIEKMGTTSQTNIVILSVSLSITVVYDPLIRTAKSQMWMKLYHFSKRIQSFEYSQLELDLLSVTTPFEQLHESVEEPVSFVFQVIGFLFAFAYL